MQTKQGVNNLDINSLDSTVGFHGCLIFCMSGFAMIHTVYMHNKSICFTKLTIKIHKARGRSSRTFKRLAEKVTRQVQSRTWNRTHVPRLPVQFSIRSSVCHRPQIHSLARDKSERIWLYRALNYSNSVKIYFYLHKSTAAWKLTELFPLSSVPSSIFQDWVINSLYKNKKYCHSNKRYLSLATQFNRHALAIITDHLLTAKSVLLR